MEKVNVNDGNGLHDNVGLIETLIVDCERVMKALVSGEYMRFSALMVGMVQKLNNLHDGVKNDMESLKKQVEDLQRFVDDINDAKGDSDV